MYAVATVSSCVMSAEGGGGVPGGLACRLLPWGVLGLAVLVQVRVLYTPDVPGAAPFPHADKVIHTVVFAVPVLLAVLARVRLAVAAGVSAVHAPVSEMVQATWVPGRSGDPLDALADLVGVGVAVLVVWVVRRRAARPSRRLAQF